MKMELKILGPEMLTINLRIRRRSSLRLGLGGTCCGFSFWLVRRRSFLGIFWRIGCGSGLRLSAVRRCPERQIIPEKLHDKGAVAVGLLRKRI